VLTEDSDLIAYGATRVPNEINTFLEPNLTIFAQVLFKLDTSDFSCEEIALADLGNLKSLDMRDFTMSMLRHICIISGCDYIDGVRGYGIKKAHKIVQIAKGNASDVFRKLQSESSLPDNYEHNFRIADLTYQHQRIFDPVNNVVTFLREVPPGVDTSQWDFLGEPLPDDIAVGIARGSIVHFFFPPSFFLPLMIFG